MHAVEGGGFDPSEVREAVRNAGFGPRDIRLKATGRIVTWEGMPALEFPGKPALLILGGGAGFDELENADLPAGSLLWVEGLMHPSHADKPAGMMVEQWRRVVDPSLELSEQP